jgi:phosphate transport system substrate-binding protein
VPSRVVTFAFLAALAAGGSKASAEIVRVGGTGAAQGLMQRLGEAFSAASPGDTLEVMPGLGSTGGIAAVIDGALAIAVTARVSREAEREKGVHDVPFLETPFIFVSSGAQPHRLSRSEVVAVYDGALRVWPDGNPIKPILRPRSDTTSDLLVASFEGMRAALEKTRKRQDVPVAATDQDNAQLAEKIAHSLAAMTLLQLITERPRVRAIALDGVEPSLARMEDGSYLLRTALHLVVAAQPGPAAQRFIDFTRTPAAERIIRESGGLPLTVHSATVR